VDIEVGEKAKELVHVVVLH